MKGSEAEQRSLADDDSIMEYALELARAGEGVVEPNPMVGAVLVNTDRKLIGKGYHERYGEAHAEVNAIKEAGKKASDAVLFVTLEPCSHQGKTPPCVEAILAAGIKKVVIGCRDPAEHGEGRGIERLLSAGVDVQVGVKEEEADALIEPFKMLMQRGRPWVHAKWAMTLDGRIATRTGHSQWISGEPSRAEVHRLRGRMDAIITGAGTVRADDPLLTARPLGVRTAKRVVIDTDGTVVRPGGQLMKTLSEAPVMICAAERHADLHYLHYLAEKGAEVFVSEAENRQNQVKEVLSELGRQRMTNVLLEAGPGLSGSFSDGGFIDEVHVFVAPKIVGGIDAKPPIGGKGKETIPSPASLRQTSYRCLGDDILIEGRVRKSQSGSEQSGKK